MNVRIRGLASALSLAFVVTAAAESNVCLGQTGLTLDDIAAALKLTDAEMRALQDGELIQRVSEEKSKKELATTLVVVLFQPFDVVAGYVEDETVIRADADLIAFRKIDDREPTRDDFEEAVFARGESGEIRELADVEAGSIFNLSTEEIAGFSRLRRSYSGRCERDPACFAAFNEAWRDTLLERTRVYRLGGLAGIADYDRGESAARPADELRYSLKALWLLEHEMPELYRALLEYPASQVTGSRHTYYWKKTTIRGRPTFSLSHRITYESGEGLFVIERDFYAQQSYNSLQRAGAVFPLDNGSTICFYNHRTSTDQVTGFGSGTRRAIGRKLMINEIKKNLLELQSKGAIRPDR